MKANCILFLSLMLAGRMLFSQADSAILMPEAVIRADRFALLDIASPDDSLPVKRVPEQSTTLGDLLSRHTLIHIRQYGPTGLASPSLRGSSPSQLALLWNGLNIQSPMNGQLDLNLLPSFFFERADVIYGPSASLAGSGASGGSIRLSTEPGKIQGWHPGAYLSLASFSNRVAGLSLSGGGERFQTKSALFYKSGKNDYPYMDGDHLKYTTHARMRQLGLQHHSSLALAGGRLAVNYLHLRSDRQLPPGIFEANSKKSIQNANDLFQVGWKGGKRRHFWNINGGLLREKIDYNDTASGLYARNRSLSLIFQPDYSLQLNNRLLLHAGLSGRQDRARLDTQSSDVSRYETAALIHLLYSPDEKSQFTLALRQGYSSQGVQPFIPTLAMARTRGNFIIKAKAGRHYHEPTLNDLYWKPGGNPNLKAERGWAGDLALAWGKTEVDKSYLVELRSFVNVLKEQIVWLPVGGLWQPENQARSFSRGLELKVRYDRSEGPWKWGVEAGYLYVKATKDRWNYPFQQPFTPQHTASAALNMEYKRLAIRYQHRYTGIRFLGETSSFVLPAYHLGDVDLNYQMHFGKSRMEVFVRIHNIWNQNYRVTPAFYMPLRNWNTGLNLKF